MAEKGYSQLPVVDEDKEIVGMLTTNTISRWLGKSVDIDIFSLRDTPVSLLLEFVEANESYKLKSRTASVFDAVYEFEKASREGLVLAGILLTANGKPTEKLLGMVTLSDLPKIYQELSLSRR